MKRFDSDLPSEQLKEKILDAADKRFKILGYKKTAMAEIASDMGMSTANLYRYFPSKLDIAESFALRSFVKMESGLRQAVNLKTVSAASGLRNMVFYLLHYNFRQLNEYPKINEIIDALCAERPALVARIKQGELDVLMGILEKGRDQDGWDIDDLEQIGLAILSSWLMFSTPAFMCNQTLKQLEKYLNNIMDITFNGLNKRV